MFLDQRRNRLRRFHVGHLLRQVGGDDLDLLALLVGEVGAAGLLVDVERFLALLDHLAHDVENFGVAQRDRSAPLVSRCRIAALISRSVETRRAWPAFIASFKALLISSRNTAKASRNGARWG